MNPSFANADTNPNKMNPLHRPAKQLRDRTETMLRDMAYVLQLTRQVKEQIMHATEEVVA